VTQRSSDYELFEAINRGYQQRYSDSYGRAEESKPRMAVDGLLSALGFGGGGGNSPRPPGSSDIPFFGRNGRVASFVTSPRGIATGGGLAALGGLIAAAQEFNNPDPTRSGFQNAAAGIGSGLGTTGGAIAGGLIGSLIAGPGVGTFAGQAIGAALGGASGKGLTELVSGLIEPSEESKALRRAVEQARRMGDVQLELEAKRLPLAEAAQRLAIERERQAMLNQSLGYALQQASTTSPIAQLMIAGAGR